MFSVHGISAQRGGVDECSGEEDVFAMVGSILLLSQYLIVKKQVVVWFLKNQCLLSLAIFLLKNIENKWSFFRLERTA